MNSKIRVESPRYQQIAMDIASKIVKKNYTIGEKIYARSAIASQYGVSSETARRAICILSDLGIVETAKGSGVVIKSYEKALEFIHHYDAAETVNDIKKDLKNSVDRQRKELEYFNSCLAKLMDKTERLQYINPFIPFEIEIISECPYVNKTVAEVNFWHNTSATIVAIKRSNALIMSPGPYAIFQENDTFYFVGDEDCKSRVQKFLYE